MYEGIFARIEKLIADKGLTLKALSDGTGIPYRSLQNYISGRNAPSVDAVAKCALYLGVETDYLIFGGVDIDQAALATAIKEALGTSITWLSTNDQGEVFVRDNIDGVQDTSTAKNISSAVRKYYLYNRKVNRGKKKEDYVVDWGISEANFVSQMKARRGSE